MFCPLAALKWSVKIHTLEIEGTWSFYFTAIYMVCAVSSYTNLAQHEHDGNWTTYFQWFSFLFCRKKSSVLFFLPLLSIYLTWHYYLTWIACSFITSCCYYYLRGKMTSSTNKSNASMTKVNLEEPPTLSRRLVQLPTEIQYKHGRISNWLLTNSLNADKSTPEGATQTKTRNT